MATKIMQCKICKNTSIKALFSANDYLTRQQFSIVKCTSCNCVYTDVHFTESQMKPFYMQEGYKKNGAMFNKLLELIIVVSRKIRVQYITSYIKKGTVLDIGCGRGIELNLLSNKGFDCYGTEKGWRKPPADMKRIKLFSKELGDCHFPTAFFDAVLLFHSYEHLPEPVQTMNEIKRITKKDGLLFIEVPNIESWQARLTKSHWFHLDVPRHLFHFSPQTLKTIIETNGFKIIKEDSFSWEYGPFGLTQSIINMLFTQQKNALFELLKEKKWRQALRDPIWIPIALFLPFIAAISVPFALFESIYHRGAVVRITARKM